MKWLLAILLTATITTGQASKEPEMVPPIGKIDAMGNEQNIDNMTRKVYLRYMAAKSPEEKKSLLKTYTRSMAQMKYGWSQSQFDLIDKIWTQESQWNPKAQNKTSGAWGIPQMMTKTKPKNPFKQIDVGLNYISSRYKTPDVAHEHKMKTGWY